MAEYELQESKGARPSSTSECSSRIGEGQRVSACVWRHVWTMEALLLAIG